MNTHRPHIIAYADRSVPVCCDTMSFKEYFGDLRVASSKRHILRHLESAYHVSAEDISHEAEFHIKDTDLICPLCESDLELSKDDFGLLRETEPSTIQCEKGHEFDAYYKDHSLFMWYDGEDAHTPFST